MPRKKPQVGRTKTENRLFYVILMQDGKSLYIGHTAAADGARTAFQNHRRGKNLYTKQFFAGTDPGNLPGMYRLEEYKCTRVDAYKRLLAWVSLLTSEGYECLAGDQFLDDAKTLSGKSKNYFSELQERFLDGCAELFAPEKNLFADYGKKKSRPQSDDGDKILTVRLSQKEYDALAALAAEKHETMNRYCRSRLINRNIIHVDFHFLLDYLMELDEIKSLMKQLIYTIYQTQKYYPADLENVQRMADTIGEHSAEIRKACNRNMLNLNRKVCAKITDNETAEQEEEVENI